MKRPLQLPLAIALALAGGNALALGLGPVQVKSRLNQPLEAEIPVIQASAGEAEGLLVSLADAEDFARIGISRSGVPVPLEFTLVQGAGGQAVIRVTSQEPVRQSYLDFLVEANWPNGRLLREYTILLDPPLTAPARSTAAAPAAPAPAPTAPARSHPLAEAPAPSRAPAPATQPATPAAPQVSDGRFGPVESGQTLSQVARQVRPGDDLNRVMLALYRANPDAFYKDNINALRRGAILRVPDEQELAAVGSRQEAAEQVRSFWQEWQGTASTTRVAAAPATEATRPSRSRGAGDGPASSGERLALVPPRADSGSDATGDRPGSGSGSGSAGNGAQAELARTQEALASREQEAGELRSRVSELEELNTKTERLLSLKDSEIAELQRRLAQLQQAAGGDAEPATATATVTTEPVTEPVAEPVASTPAPDADDPDSRLGDGAAADSGDGDAEAPVITVASDGEDVEAADDAPADSGEVTGQEPWGQPAADQSPAEAIALGDEAPAEAPTAPEEEPAVMDEPTRVVMPAPAVEPEPWYQKPWAKPAALGGGVLVLLGVLLGLRRKRPAGGGRSSSLADSFADGPLGSVPDAASEAEKLRAELAGDPQNVGLHLELLSIYYAEGDVARFEDQAAAMHACVDDPGQPEWLEARAMGQELAPDNPLFSDLPAAAVGTTEEMHPDEGPASGDEAALAGVDGSGFDDSEPAAAPAPAPAADPPDSFDWQDGAPAAGEEEVSGFGLLGEAPVAGDADPFAGIDPLPDTAPALGEDALADSSPVIEPPQEVPPVDAGLDVGELAPLEWEPAPAGDEVPMADLTAELDAGFDLDPAPAAAPPTAPEAEAEEADAAAAAGFDLYGEDAVATKLDLARAYLDMGDPDGARSMLEEVLSEGNGTQREEAQTLLDELD